MDLTLIGLWLIFAGLMAAASSAAIVVALFKGWGRPGVGRAAGSRPEAGAEGVCRGCDGSRLRRF